MTNPLRVEDPMKTTSKNSSTNVTAGGSDVRMLVRSRARTSAAKRTPTRSRGAARNRRWRPSHPGS